MRRIAIAGMAAGFLVVAGAQAKDLGKLSDVLALGYLGQDVAQMCGFAKDGHGNLLRSAASASEAAIEDKILAGLTDEDANSVIQASERKSRALLGRMTVQTGTPQPGHGATAVDSWCAQQGEAVIETVAILYHRRHADLAKEIEAAKR